MPSKLATENRTSQSKRGTRDRVLLISPIPTHPATAGNRVRILRLARALMALGLEVDFAHVLRESGDSSAMAAYWGERYFPVEYNLKSIQQHTLPTRLIRKARKKFRKAMGWGSALDDWYADGLDAQIAQIAKRGNYSIVIVEYVFMSRALLNFGDDVLKIIDTHDVFANRSRRFQEAGGRGWFSTTERQEAKGLLRADRVIAIQDNEAGYFRRLQSRHVVTVGDVPELDCIAPAATNASVPGRLLLISSNNASNRQACEWFINGVLPAVQQRVPDVTLVIVGGLCSSVGARSGVELRGAVEVLEDEYAAAAVVINPALVGTGLKIKTVEALAYGKALVTTEVGGEGLEEGWGEAFRVAHGPAAFADELVALLSSPEAAASLGREARRFAERAQQGAMDALAEVVGVGNA